MGRGCPRAVRPLNRESFFPVAGFFPGPVVDVGTIGTGSVGGADARDAFCDAIPVRRALGTAPLT